MGKMHELLAVENTLAGNYNRDYAETQKVLSKPNAFMRVITNKEHFAEDQRKLDTRDVQEITTTVPERLKWFGPIMAKYLDVQLQKDKTNQIAKADIILDDGTTIAKDVPATTLLMMETKLGTELRALLETIPTLDASKSWKYNDKEGLYKSEHETPTFTTKKTFVPLTLAPATDKHPANVKEGWEDVPAAKVTREVFSGMISSTQKSMLLANLDNLTGAIKKARQRANMAEVVQGTIGSDIFKYLTKDLSK